MPRTHAHFHLSTLLVHGGGRAGHELPFAAIDLAHAGQRLCGSRPDVGTGVDPVRLRRGDSRALPFLQLRRRDADFMSLPFVFINMAMSADGKIATANRAVSSFSSRRDFEHLLELRATADAVMSGARTVGQEEINLGPGPSRFRRLRLKEGLAEYNVRIVASGSGSLDPRAAVFRHRFSPIIVLASGRASGRKLSRLRAVADAVKICGRSETSNDCSAKGAAN